MRTMMALKTKNKRSQYITTSTAVCLPQKKKNALFFLLSWDEEKKKKKRPRAVLRTNKKKASTGMYVRVRYMTAQRAIIKGNGTDQSPEN